jgi:hypothetical protein
MAIRASLTTLLCCLCLGLALPGPASQLIRRTLDELGAGSDIIFIGRCESVNAHWNADRTLILTANRFRVVRTIKGSPVESITLEELGGTVGDTTLRVTDAPRFAVGDEVLLCVRRTPLGRWETFGAGQGRFRLTQDARGRVWARNDFYRPQLAAMGGSAEEGAPLAALVGRLQAAAPVRARP